MGCLKTGPKLLKKKQSKPLKNQFFCILLMFFTSKVCQIASKYYVYTVVIIYKSLHIYLCHISSKKISFTPFKTHCRPKLACNIGVFIPYMFCLHNVVATGCNQFFSSFSKVGNWQLQSGSVEMCGGVQSRVSTDGIRPGSDCLERPETGLPGRTREGVDMGTSKLSSGVWNVKLLSTQSINGL